METIELNGVKYVKKEAISDNIVLVRTYSAGVHFGTLASREGKEVVLTNARRLYQWSGACSLSQVATDGVRLSGSKISVIVPKITFDRGNRNHSDVRESRNRDDGSGGVESVNYGPGCGYSYGPV